MSDAMFYELIEAISSPNCADWLLLLVTGAYFVTTVFVYRANKRMAEAADEQIRTAMAISELSSKVQLFDKRQKLYDEAEDYVERVIPTWENDSTKGKLFFDYTNMHVLALFDQEILDLWNSLKKINDKIIELHSDYEHAERKGDCRGRDMQTIRVEVDAANSEAVKKFQVFKSIVFKRYLKL